MVKRIWLTLKWIILVFTASILGLIVGIIFFILMPGELSFPLTTLNKLGLSASVLGFTTLFIVFRSFFWGVLEAIFSITS